METTKEKLIFILLGPSGSGKTSCGEAVAYDPAPGALTEGKVVFLSTGDKLREREILSPWQEPDMEIVKAFCYKLMNETFDAFRASTTHRILLLDCVNDLGDAQYITSLAKEYGFKMSRAFVMDVDPKELQECWDKRGEARDIFRGSADTYLYNWRRNFNDVFNYYKRMNMLYSAVPITADLPSFMLLELDKLSKLRRRRIFKDENPVIRCQNNVCHLLVDSVKINNIFTSLLSILNVTWFDFALPASFIHCSRDVMWVVNPTRYHVTLKASGVRFLLVKIHEETFLINRKNEVYPCLIGEGTELPANTVLDGELMPSTSMSDISHPGSITRLETNVFMIFDVLAVSGQVMWKCPFSERYEMLSQLSISKDIVSVMELASGAVHSSAGYRKLHTVPEEENSTVKLKVNVVIKEHRSSTPDTIFACLSSPMGSIFYPYNGLVFTPETPYIFGPDPLLFTWRPEDLTHCNIAYKDLMSGKRRSTGIHSFCNDMKYYPECGIYGRIIECEWDERRGSWNCLFLRHDKATPDSDETLDHVERTGCPYTKDDLVVDIKLLRESNTQILRESNGEEEKLVTQSTHPQNHPTINYSFDELYSQINELVKLDEVERTIDPSTNLETFNYYSLTSCDHPIVQLCQGLVLHLESKTIVTKPFVRSFQDLGADEPNPQEVVEATVKFDGSLGIAFRWNNEVKVTTRRRMDSEPATWAKLWIEEHCNTTSFLTGYTYLFEIIHKVNIVIVKYPFQGLVLLAVTDENGLELSYDEVLRCGKITGFFMVTPRITGPYSEVSWYCGGASGNASASRTDPPQLSGALPTVSRQREGWVIKFNDGARQKIVYNWWESVSRSTRLIHPQIVWLLVKYDKIEAEFGNVPNHIRREIQSMMKAIARRFEEALELVDQCLAGSLGIKQTQASKMSTKYINEWWDPEISPEAPEQGCEEESFRLFEIFTLEGGDSTAPNSIKDEVGNNTENHCGNSNDDGEDRECLQAAANDEETNQNSGSLLELMHKLQPYKRKSKRILNGSRLDHFLDREINILPFYNGFKRNFLRLPILEYIRPSEPAIKGYEPSDECKQTWSKGWKTLRNDRRELIQQLVLQDSQQAPVLLQMPIEVILLFLDFLDGSSVAKLAKVCWRLRQIVQSRRSLRKKIAEAEKQHYARY